MVISSKSYYVFIGNPGSGKSTLLNGIADKVLFKSGYSFGKGCTKVLQEEEVEGKGIFMDTPGLTDTKLRKQAAEAISVALKKTGNFRIFFVVTLEAGRVRPADVATIVLVTDALYNIENVCYSIIINKLEDVEIQMLNENEDGAVDDLMASLMGDNVRVKTTNIYYMSRVEALTKAKGMDANSTDPSISKKLLYKLPRKLFEFIMMAPRVYIEASKVQDVKADEFEAMQQKFEEQIELLKGNLEEQKAVNARNQKALEEQKRLMEEAQKQAAEDRAKHKAELDKMKEGFEAQIADSNREHENTIQRMQKEAQEKSAEDRKEMLDSIEKMQKKHQERMDEMSQQHRNELNAAAARSDGASGIHGILGSIPLVGPVISGIGKAFKWF